MALFIYPQSQTTIPGVATEAKQDTMITELQSANTELDTHTTHLASIAAEDFATQTTLAALLTELQLKADLTETQPVSAASLPLPTGASTEATLSSILTELQAKADLAETQPVSVASMPLPTGASTEATLSSVLTELQAKADLAETQPVSLASQPLPTGAATEAKQDTGNTSLSTIAGDTTSLDTKVGEVSATPTANTVLARLKSIEDKHDTLLTELQAKADLAETQPVSAASLPLPSGAATEAKQDTGNTSLSTIAGDTTSLDTKTGEVSATPTANTILARLKSIEDKHDTLLTELQAKADLAETQPVSAASLPLPSGAATEAKQDTGNTSLSNIDTSLNNIEADIDNLEQRLAGSLVPELFDYIALTYVASGNGKGEVETAVYKTGGAAGTTVATLTLAYDSSNRVSSVTKS